MTIIIYIIYEIIKLNIYKNHINPIINIKKNTLFINTIIWRLYQLYLPF